MKLSRDKTTVKQVVAGSVPERRELFDDVVLEASDHHLVLQQQVQLIRVLASANERHADVPSTLRRLPSPAPSFITSRLSGIHMIFC